jgi:hypothetical protein
MLRAMPALLDELQALSNHSATSLAILNPCMSDIVTTIGYMASADAYRDANGNMLRVHPYIGPSTPSDKTHIQCSGSH